MTLRDRVLAHPAYARAKALLDALRIRLLTQDTLSACAVRVAERKGWRLIAYSLIFDVALSAVLAALADRREGMFSFYLTLVWVMRGVFFLKSAGYDLVRYGLMGNDEAQIARFGALLDEAEFPPNSAGLSARAYLRAVIDFRAAPQRLRLAAETINTGFTSGFGHDGVVQEYLAARAFGRALTLYARRRGGK